VARRAVAASFVLGSLALLGQGLTQGCTQDFSNFDGSGGNDPTGPASQSSTGPGTPTSSSSSGSGNPTTTTGAGGDGGGPTSTSTGGGAGGGTGGGCVDASDCDDDNPCTTDACDDDVCENLPVDDGPIGGVDDPEDCRNHECLAGEEIDEPDNTEDPTDANPPCELTICAGGAPTPENAAEGTECGPAPQECDGDGTCRGCDPEGPDSQCGDATECSAPTCDDDETCNPGFLDDATVLPDPVDGDCQRDECPGDNVNAQSVADDTDVPANLPCASAACDDGGAEFTRLDEGDSCLGQVGVCDGLGNLAANCKTCRDTAGGAGTDAGCSAGAPICDELGNSGAGVCRVCNNTMGGGGTDLGCPDTDQVCDPAGIGTCVDCYTEGGGTVVNCVSGEVCEPVGLGSCSTCYDEGAGVTDAGCEDDTPACDEGTDTCEECQDAGDCAGNDNGTICSNAGGTTCGCNAVGDCSTSNRGRICRNGAGDDFCGCNAIGDCAGIAGADSCAGNICLCDGDPC
jgi:hypothetical protein